MLSLNEIDPQLGGWNFVADVQNALAGFINESETIIGGLFRVGGMVAVRKKREVAICFKAYVFKVAYYLNSQNRAHAFVQKDEESVYLCWRFAQLYKERLVRPTYPSATLSQNFPETLRDDGAFENKFVASVMQLLLIAENYGNGFCAIPIDVRSLDYKDPSKHFEKCLVQSFAEDLLLSESFRAWDLGINYYGGESRSQILSGAKYNSSNVKQYSLAIQGFIANK